jgi:hypothetical protein
LQYEFQRGYFFNAEFLLFIVNKKVWKWKKQFFKSFDR